MFFRIQGIIRVDLKAFVPTFHVSLELQDQLLKVANLLRPRVQVVLWMLNAFKAASLRFCSRGVHGLLDLQFIFSDHFFIMPVFWAWVVVFM